MPAVPGSDPHQVAENGDGLLALSPLFQGVGELMCGLRSEHPRGRVEADRLIAACELLERPGQVVVEPEVARVIADAPAQDRLGLGPGPHVAEGLAQQIEADRRSRLVLEEAARAVRRARRAGRSAISRASRSWSRHGSGSADRATMASRAALATSLRRSRRTAAQSSRVMARAVAISAGRALIRRLVPQLGNGVSSQGDALWFA